MKFRYGHQKNTKHSNLLVFIFPKNEIESLLLCWHEILASETEKLENFAHFGKRLIFLGIIVSVHLQNPTFN